MNSELKDKCSGNEDVWNDRGNNKLRLYEYDMKRTLRGALKINIEEKRVERIELRGRTVWS